MSEQSFSTRCSHCNAVAHFKISHDSGIDTLAKAISQLQGKTRIQAGSIMKKHAVNHCEFGFALYTCPKCKTLHNPFTITIEYDEIMLFQPFYKCHQCNSTLQKTTEPVSAHACKNCGNKQLSNMADH